MLSDDLAPNKLSSGLIFDIKGYYVDREVRIGESILGQVPRYEILEYGKGPYKRDSLEIIFTDSNVTSGVSYTYTIYAYDFKNNLSDPVEVTITAQ